MIGRSRRIGLSRAGLQRRPRKIVRTKAASVLAGGQTASQRLRYNVIRGVLSALLLASGVLLAQSADAQTTCTPFGTGSPACVPVPESRSPDENVSAWVIPETNRGARNGLTAEQTMVVTFGPGSISNVYSSFFIFSPSGRVSDLITITNTAAGVAIIFTSDPPAPSLPPFASFLGTEDPVSGLVVGLPSLVVRGPTGIEFRVAVASDGEAYFDPFNYGFDTSDGIRVCFGDPRPAAFCLNPLLLNPGSVPDPVSLAQGASLASLDSVAIAQVPEPISLALLGTGLVGLGVVRRARTRPA